ncbi:MAG: hypothetical protein ACLFTV_17535, partial [Desulfococcaceae bacterium]
MLIAIALSFLVFLIWNVFFVDQEALQPRRPPADATAPSSPSETPSTSEADSRAPASQPPSQEAEAVSADQPP